MIRLLLAALVSAAALAQNSVEGAVVSDKTGMPLRRAHVVLKPEQARAESIGIDTDGHGAFSIRDVPPGRYSIAASRDGYLASSDCLIGTLPLPRTFTIGDKESITGLQFRLRPFAVMAGRIAFDDGEPAMGVAVQASREYRDHLRHGYAVAGRATTNDRGEFRMFGLAAGSYLVAAVYDDPVRFHEEVRDAPALRYTTTYYGDTINLGEASAVPLDYGQEVTGIDIVLERSRKVTIRGRVRSATTGATLAVRMSLEQLDAHGVASAALSAPFSFGSDNEFEIRDVAPGSYLLWAEGSDGGKPVSGHIPLAVGPFDINDAEVTVQGDRQGRAVLVTDNGVTLAEAPSLRFEPRNERAKIVNASETPDGYNFSLRGGETYDLFADNLPNDYYVAAVRVNGADMMPFGIDGNAASLDNPFEVVLDSRGGAVSGRVQGSDDTLWTRASVALIPDPPNGRVQAYREGAADENGVFTIHGVPPGHYVLIAWRDEPPCDYWNPDALAACRSAGASLDFGQGSQQDVDLRMKTPQRR